MPAPLKPGLLPLQVKVQRSSWMGSDFFFTDSYSRWQLFLECTAVKPHSGSVQTFLFFSVVYTSRVLNPGVKCKVHWKLQYIQTHKFQYQSNSKTQLQRCKETLTIRKWENVYILIICVASYFISVDANLKQIRCLIMISDCSSLSIKMKEMLWWYNEH